jgi:Flp pilus assembly secretin CpaC
MKAINTFLMAGIALGVMACSDASYLQKTSPAEGFKDYKEQSSAVIGVGEPVSKRQMKANATFRMQGEYALSSLMSRLASVYNLAVRYSDDVRQETSKNVVINELTFNETRNYIEDVYGVQIVREGERRILILPSLDEKRIDKFAPGLNVSLSQVVRGLAKLCNYNMVITENKQQLATTLITTSFKDITCLDAFDAVLTPHGLSLMDNGTHHSIGGFPQRQWVLDLYEPERTQSQKVNYSSSFSGEGDSGSSSSGGDGSISIQTTRNLWDDLEEDLNALVDKSCEEMQNNVSDISSLLPADSQGATSSVSADAGSYECGYVRINRTVGMVQMRAPYSVLSSADEIIRYVKDIASRRLLVEARVMAVSKNHGFTQGGFSRFARDEGDSYLGGFEGQNTSIVASIADLLTGDATALDSINNGLFQFEGGDIRAAVSLAEQFGTTYQLMQPMMEVMDRQMAVMVDGRNEKYFLVTTERETTDSGTTTDITAEEKTQFVGIQFAVTAQVADEGEPHTLSIQVPMTEIDRFVTVPDGSNSQVPVVTTRVIDQKVRIRDGEVKVIGGLTRTIAIDKESGVPLMRNIPMAGKLLNDEDISYENVEFIVLLQVKRLY